MPSAPAFETAAASRGTAAMGAWTIGRSIPSISHPGVATAFVPAAILGRPPGGPLSLIRIRHRPGRPPVPAVKLRVVVRIPGLVKPRRAQIPVRADLGRGGTQVTPQLVERRAPPEPVAVIDTVNDQPGLEHQRVRDHRVV